VAGRLNFPNYFYDDDIQDAFQGNGLFLPIGWVNGWRNFQIIFIVI
jgi:hypothetical protein